MNLDIFKSIPYKTLNDCTVCEQQFESPVIELPSLPITEIYVNEKPTKELGIVDQSFNLCQRCGHAQLSNILDIDVLYGTEYSFRTSKSMSVQGNNAFINFINKITDKTNFETILEVGCNDLYLLKSLNDKGSKFIGIDPTLKGKDKELSTDSIKVIGDFFENIDPKEYKTAGKTMVVSSHVIEHIVDPKKLLKNLLDSLNDDTLFILQFPGFDVLVDDRRFDQIYHHHVHYFSLHSLTYLLNELGCEVIDSETNYHYWGSLMVAFRKAKRKKPNTLPDKITLDKIRKNYELFKNAMKSANEYLNTLKGEKVYGYGAGLQLPILSYHLGNDFSALECILDDSKDKDGLFYLNLPVMVRHPSKIGDLKDATVFLTGVNFSRAILRRLFELKPKRVVSPISII